MDPVVATYGALLAVGGSVGFAKKGSVPSLVAGGGSGLFFIYAAQDISVHGWSAKAVASLLCLAMSMRARKAAKFMPAGGVAVLSAAVLVYLLNIRA